MSQREHQPSNRQILPLILVAIGLLLVVTVVIWQTVRPGPVTATSIQPTRVQPVSATDADIPFPDVKRVTLAEAKAALDNKKAVFLDVRSADSYKAAHIPGAVNIPLLELEGRLNELNPDQWIITYCT